MNRFSKYTSRKGLDRAYTYKADTPAKPKYTSIHTKKVFKGPCYLRVFDLDALQQYRKYGCVENVSNIELDQIFQGENNQANGLQKLLPALERKEEIPLEGRSEASMSNIAATVHVWRL